MVPFLWIWHADWKSQSRQTGEFPPAPMPAVALLMHVRSGFSNVKYPTLLGSGDGRNERTNTCAHPDCTTSLHRCHSTWRTVWNHDAVSRHKWWIFDASERLSTVGVSCNELRPTSRSHACPTPAAVRVINLCSGIENMIYIHHVSTLLGLGDGQDAQPIASDQSDSWNSPLRALRPTAALKRCDDRNFIHYTHRTWYLLKLNVVRCCDHVWGTPVVFENRRRNVNLSPRMILPREPLPRVASDSSASDALVRPNEYCCVFIPYCHKRLLHIVDSQTHTPADGTRSCTMHQIINSSCATFIAISYWAFPWSKPKCLPELGEPSSPAVSRCDIMIMWRELEFPDKMFKGDFCNTRPTFLDDDIQFICVWFEVELCRACSLGWAWNFLILWQWLDIGGIPNIEHMLIVTQLV